MKKRSIAWAGLLLGLLLPFIAACGGGLLQKSGNPDVAAHPAGGQLYVLDNYAASSGQKNLSPNEREQLYAAFRQSLETKNGKQPVR